jgi:hypothetical protein
MAAKIVRKYKTNNNIHINNTQNNKKKYGTHKVESNAYRGRKQSKRNRLKQHNKICFL